MVSSSERHGKLVLFPLMQFYPSTIQSDSSNSVILGRYWEYNNFFEEKYVPKLSTYVDVALNSNIAYVRELNCML